MLQTRTVEPGTLGLLKSLMSKQYIDPFFLVGGTALALQMGHRMSIDPDMFSVTDFDNSYNCFNCIITWIDENEASVKASKPFYFYIHYIFLFVSFSF